jgi:hypothetical protein
VSRRRSRVGYFRLLLIDLLLTGVRHVGCAEGIGVRLPHDVGTVDAAEE